MVSLKNFSFRKFILNSCYMLDGSELEELELVLTGNEWVSQSSYTGSWKEVVLRSALALKPFIFKSTGTS
jgi:hypothetical protein